MTFARAALVLMAVWGASACASAEDDQSTAAALLEAAGIEAGLVVHVGCGEGRWTEALADALRGKPVLVHGIDSDGSAMEQARAKATDHQGRLAFASVCSFATLPYPEHYINLLVAERFEALAQQGLTQTECARALAPQGIAALRGAVQPDASAGWRLLKRAGEWTLFTKDRPAGMDDHTHYNYDAACSRTSHDRLAGPPGRIVWIDGPNWTCSPSGPITQLSAGGRTFSVINESHRFGSNKQSPRTFLYAHDAYNGVRLWKQPTASGKLTTVATRTHVYSVPAGDAPLCALDAATGKEIRRYPDLAGVQWVLFDGGRLVGSTSKNLVCVEAESGKALWSKPFAVRDAGVSPNAALSEGRLYFFDSPKKGKGPRMLGCLDAASGEELWKRDISGDLKSAEGQAALCLYAPGLLVVGEWPSKGATDGGVHGFSPTDGAHLWFHDYRLVTSGRPSRHKGSSFIDGYMVDGLYWYLDGNGNEPGKQSSAVRRANGWFGLDPKSGEVKRKLELKEDEYIDDSCHRTQATTRYFLGGHCAFYEREAGTYTKRSDAIHNGCGFGMLPANGLFYSGSFYLDYYLQGEFATAVAAPLAPSAPDEDGRLVKGPAYGAEAGAEAAAADWPMLRGNAARSLSNAASVPAKLKELWQVQAGRRLCQPVCVGESVYVSDVDGLCLIALDAASGKVKWKVPLGSRAYAPPTYYKGLLLSGCADGWVYCLKASDGALVWRYRAAPAERHIMVRERLESVWPVENGVLVKDGVAYFVAGRHPEIDGGIDAFAADPFSGKILWHRRLTEGPKVRMLVAEGDAVGFGAKASFLCKDGAPGPTPKTTGDALDLDRLDGEHAAGKASASIWQHARVRALAKAGDVFFAAGPPPERIVPGRGVQALDMPEDDPAITTGELTVFDANGGLLGKLPLDALPVFDGLAAAGGRLFLATQDGKLRCFGKP